MEEPIQTDTSLPVTSASMLESPELVRRDTPVLDTSGYFSPLQEQLVSDDTDTPDKEANTSQDCLVSVPEFLASISVGTDEAKDGKSQADREHSSMEASPMKRKTRDQGRTRKIQLIKMKADGSYVIFDEQNDPRETGMMSFAQTSTGSGNDVVMATKQDAGLQLELSGGPSQCHDTLDAQFLKELSSTKHTSVKSASNSSATSASTDSADPSTSTSKGVCVFGTNITTSAFHGTITGTSSGTVCHSAMDSASSVTGPTNSASSIIYRQSERQKCAARALSRAISASSTSISSSSVANASGSAPSATSSAVVCQPVANTYNNQLPNIQSYQVAADRMQFLSPGGNQFITLFKGPNPVPQMTSTPNGLAVVYTAPDHYTGTPHPVITGHKVEPSTSFLQLKPASHVTPKQLTYCQTPDVALDLETTIENWSGNHGTPASLNLSYPTPRAPNNTPYSGSPYRSILHPSLVQEVLTRSPIGPITGRTGGRIRSKHNAKERARRARVKIACDLLRQVVPGMTPGTDKATVFEYAYEYIKYLQKTAPDCHEKDFLLNAIPLVE